MSDNPNVIPRNPDGTLMAIGLEATQLLVKAAIDSANAALTAIKNVDGVKKIVDPVAVGSSALPAGASTEATLAAAVTALSNILTRLGDGNQRTQVDNFPASQAVTGPLTDAQLRAAAVAVAVASLPLPAGAATAGRQDTGNDSLASIDMTLASLLAELQQKLESGGTVNVGNFPATQPVSGPLTDAQLRATSVPVNVDNFPATQPVSAAALPLPTGASTETTLASVLTELQQKTEPADNQNVAVTNWPAELGGGIEAKLSDQTDPTTFYIGSAPLGSLPGDAVWRIKRISFDGNGNFTELRWSNATAVWNNRTSETYT